MGAAMRESVTRSSNLVHQPLPAHRQHTTISLCTRLGSSTSADITQKSYKRHSATPPAHQQH